MRQFYKFINVLWIFVNRGEISGRETAKNVEYSIFGLRLGFISSISTIANRKQKKKKKETNFINVYKDCIFSNLQDIWRNKSRLVDPTLRLSFISSTSTVAHRKRRKKVKYFKTTIRQNRWLTLGRVFHICSHISNCCLALNELNLLAWRKISESV